MDRTPVSIREERIDCEDASEEFRRTSPAVGAESGGQHICYSRSRAWGCRPCPASAAAVRPDDQAEAGDSGGRRGTLLSLPEAPESQGCGPAGAVLPVPEWACLLPGSQ